MAGELNRQQICAALNVSESTIRRLEQEGLPFTPIGRRTKRYDLAECKAWLRNRTGPGPAPYLRIPSDAAVKEFIDLSMKMKRRVQPS